MKYTKDIQYVYILFAVFFIYDAFVRYQNNQNFTISILFALLATFMFFFKRRFYNKYKNGQK